MYTMKNKKKKNNYGEMRCERVRSSSPKRMYDILTIKPIKTQF